MDRQPDSRTLAWQVNLVISETRSSSHFLLDYGSRSGEFIHLMQNEHWAVKGIEPSDELRAKARRMFALSLLSDEQLTTLDELSYGVVTAWQSLSRNTDTIMLLRQFHKLLVENGSLFISLCPEDFSISEVEQMARQANFGIEKVLLFLFSDSRLSLPISDTGNIPNKHRSSPTISKKLIRSISASFTTTDSSGKCQ